MVRVRVLRRVFPFVVAVIAATCRRAAAVVIVMVMGMIRILARFLVPILDPG